LPRSSNTCGSSSTSLKSCPQRNQRASCGIRGRRPGGGRHKERKAGQLYSLLTIHDFWSGFLIQPYRSSLAGPTTGTVRLSSLETRSAGGSGLGAFLAGLGRSRCASGLLSHGPVWAGCLSSLAGPPSSGVTDLAAGERSPAPAALGARLCLSWRRPARGPSRADHPGRRCTSCLAGAAASPRRSLASTIGSRPLARDPEARSRAVPSGLLRGGAARLVLGTDHGQPDNPMRSDCLGSDADA
jgi:hypothetical protein